MLLNELVLFPPGRIRIIHLTKTNKQNNNNKLLEESGLFAFKNEGKHIRRFLLPFPEMEQKIYFCLFLNSISYLRLREKKLILIFLMS